MKIFECSYPLSVKIYIQHGSDKKLCYLFSGGFLAFQAMYPSLCESKTNNYRCAALTSLSQPCLPVSNVGPTRILPFLYLGSQQDALSQDVTQVVSLYEIPFHGPIKKIKPRNFAT